MNELDQVEDYLQSLQSRIVAELEQLDGKQAFRRDAWQRPAGGEPCTVLGRPMVHQPPPISRPPDQR